MEIGLSLGICRGGRVAWSPASLSGLYLLCPPPSSGSAGSPLATWPGAVGGRDLTGPTGLTVRLEGSTRVLEMGSNYNAYDVAGDPSETALSIHLWYRPSTPDGLNGILSIAADRGTPFVGPNWDSGQGTTAHGFKAIGNIVGPNYATDSGFYHLLSWVYDGSGPTIRTYCDGAETSIPSLTVANASVALAQIAVGGNAFDTPSGRVAWVGVGRAVHSVADIRDLRDYLRSTYPDVWSTPANIVVWVSNSLATETYSGVTSAMPYLCGTAAGTYRWYAGGRGGYTTPQLTSLSSDYGQLATASGQKVALVWEASNDFVLNAVSAATAYTNLVACKTALLAAGYTKVLVGTVIDRNATGFAAFKNAVNALIIANSGGFDGVADLTGIADLSADGAYANVTYFSDGVHPTAAGNALAVSTFNAAIAAVL